MKVLVNALSARGGGGRTYLINLLQHVDSEDIAEEFWSSLPTILNYHRIVKFAGCRRRHSVAIRLHARCGSSCGCQDCCAAFASMCCSVRAAC